MRNRSDVRGYLGFIIFLLFLTLSCGNSSGEPLRIRRNFIGMHNLKDGGPAINIGFDWTKEMGCGYVFDHVFDVQPWVGAAFARDLVPCIRVQGSGFRNVTEVVFPIPLIPRSLPAR